MIHDTLPRPLVPGDSGGVCCDGMPTVAGVNGGAKNPRASSPHRQTNKAIKLDSDHKLNIISYNVRTLSSEERLIELENALENIKWDIVGLSEVRREGEESLERGNNVFFYSGKAGGQSGVGFLISKRWINNILEFIAYSDRIAVLKFRISENQILTVVQVYAPTTSHPDAEIEEFYVILDKACDEQRGTWTIVIGDFNAKVGPRLSTDNEHILGPHGLGVRNNRGTRLLQFAFGQNLCLANSLFYKKPQRRWTWKSPNKNTKNEIDFTLTSNKTIIQNVNVINDIKFVSDHRPVRTTLVFKIKILRQQLFRNRIKNLNKDTLIANKDTFNLELKNSFEILKSTELGDIQQQYSNIERSIKSASRKIKQSRNKLKKLTSETLQLIEERQAQRNNVNSSEYSILDRKVKRNIRKDIRFYNTNLVQVALEKNKSLKIARKGITKGKSWITSMKDKTGVKHRDRDKILDICTTFYKDLYSNPMDNLEPAPEYLCADEIPPITGYEVHCALAKMNYNKSPGQDGVSTETLKIGEPILLPHLTNLFNSILQSGKFPKNFCHAEIILLHKKGDRSDIGNYRPISLISHLYKAFIKIIERRISGLLDKAQPPEQAGFRPGLSTTDHLHALNQIIEKHHEYDRPLYLAFVDYSKAFDSITHESIFTALENQNIPATYINLIRHIYYNSTASVRLQTPGPSFPIKRGVKQGDPLSPKLFTSVLEEVFRKFALDWENKGVEVSQTKLTNLRFADDIVLFSSTASELQQMLEELSRASLEVGLRMNMSKTKVMTNSSELIVEVDGENIAYVQEYLYLGQIVSFQARQDKEVGRRTENAWKSYWAMKDLMKGDLPLALKRKLMDMCILPILTYGAQTWSLTDIQKSKLGVCQRNMERSILGVKLIDRVRNSVLRSQTKIMDVAQKAACLKWDWAGHVTRMPNVLWAKRTTEWEPENARRRRGRPRKRWRDELDAYLTEWRELALDREKWKEGREAFALQWDTAGS